MTPRDDSAKDGFARDRNGELILDRFGRPVRRRSTVPPPEGNRADSARPESGHSDDTFAHNRRTPHHDNLPQPEPPRYRRQQVPPSPQASRSFESVPPAQSPRAYSDVPPAQSSRGVESVPPRPSGSPSFGSSSRRNHPTDSGSFLSRRRRDPQAARRPRRRPRFGLFKAVATLLLVFVLLMVGSLFWVDSKLNRTEALQNYSGRVGNTKGTNWLLVGSDSRAGLDKKDADRLMAGELNDAVGRTDTIMIVHVPSLGGKPTMLSLPRDSWVDIPGQGQNKLNQAFSLGGPALLQQTVEKATGLRIDRYAEIGFGGFANVVDSVGGLEMCLKEPLNDPMAGINLKAGCQEMDGPTALGYVRSRYTSARGDLDRVDRQKEFLSALSKKVASPGTILNPFRGLPTAKSLASSLTVNKKDHAWNLALLGLAMRGGATQETVPIGSYMDTYAGNVAVWDDQAAQAIFNKLK